MPALQDPVPRGELADLTVEVVHFALCASGLFLFAEHRGQVGLGLGLAARRPVTAALGNV